MRVNALLQVVQVDPALCFRVQLCRQALLLGRERLQADIVAAAGLLLLPARRQLRIQFREMSEELGLELDIEGCNRVRLEVLGRSTALVPHALEVVRELKKTHRVYLITNAVESVQRGRLGRSALAPYVEEAFISETAGAAKPSVEYFDYVFAHIDGITRENCLVIGDSLTSDIQGANNYGLACCWFNPKKAPKPESLRVDYEIRDLRELYDIVK